MPASSSLTSADQALDLMVLRDTEAAGTRLEAIADRTGGGQSREAAERVDAILEQVRLEGDAAL
ncbi:MAG: histidinol dehydrogenase, partial [Vulcanococcus sp.]